MKKIKGTIPSEPMENGVSHRQFPPAPAGAIQSREMRKEVAIDILEKFKFFGGQRAGRELWNRKPRDVQDIDIEDFVRAVDTLERYINSIDGETRGEADKPLPMAPRYNVKRGALCPSCDGELDTRILRCGLFRRDEIKIREKAPFCKWCGQAIDWRND